VAVRKNSSAARKAAAKKENTEKPAPPWLEGARPKLDPVAPDILGEVHPDLDNLDFDFEGYFARWMARELSHFEEREYQARMVAKFCRDVRDGMVTGPGVEHIAALMMATLRGHRIRLMPWDEPPVSRRSKRAMRIMLAVHQALSEAYDRNEPSPKVTDILRDQAQAHNISFSTAVADYYSVLDDPETPLHNYVMDEWFF